MNYFKVTSILTLHLFGVFLIPQIQAQQNVNLKSISNYANWTNSLIKGAAVLSDKYPYTVAFLGSVAENRVSSIVRGDPANAAAVIYFISVAGVSHYFSVRAYQQSSSAEESEIKLIFDKEVHAILDLLEEELRKSKGNPITKDSLCSTKNNIPELLQSSETFLSNHRKHIQHKMLDSTRVTERNKLVKWLTILGAIGCVWYAMKNPPLVSPQTLFVGIAIYGVLVYAHESTINVKNRFDHLNQTRLQTLKIEAAIGAANTYAQFYCSGASSTPMFKVLLKAIEGLKPLAKLCDSCDTHLAGGTVNDV